MKLKAIPPEGLQGDQILEAKETEFYAVIKLVSAALRQIKFGTSVDNGINYVSIDSIYQDKVVTSDIGGRCQAYPYTIDDNNVVTLGVPVIVVETYVPVALREAQGTFIEAIGDEAKFLIRVIESGLSGNRNYYSDAALKEALPLIEGVRVFVKSDEEHLKDKGKDFRNLIGRLTEAKFVPGKTPDSGCVQATLNLLDAGGDIATKLKEALAKGMTSLFGFSIDMIGKTAMRLVESKPVRFLVKATKVSSVDLIVEPGAGGALVRMVEAADPDLKKQEKPDMLRKRMIDKISKNLPAARVKALGDLETCDEEALEGAYKEAIDAESSATRLTEAAAAGKATGVSEDRLNEALQLVDARSHASAAIAASKLPAAAKTRLVEAFNARDKFTKAEVDASIKTEGEYIAKFTESGKVRVEGATGADIHIGESEFEKADDMLDAFFDDKHKDHRQVQSFKECYIQLTGDKRVTGRLAECDKTRMSEALGIFKEALDSTSFSNVLGNSMTRRMVAEYRLAVDFDGYSAVVSKVPIADFRSQERTRFGGYGDLAIVAENDPYPDLASPTDEKATYAVAKRGGVERLSIEMIKNDDVGAIRRIPRNMGRAAKRTLAKFVFDFFRTNPVIYDGVAFFHANHNNLLTAALDAGQFAAHRLLMLKQPEKDSNDRLGIGPKFLLTSPDLLETGYNLFNRNTNLDETFVNTLKPTIIPVWYWTDVNDWCTVADPADIPTIEIGFLDGREEPEMFVQDAPTVGSLFTNDQVSYKIRHVYGGNVTDFRGATKGVVA